VEELADPEVVDAWLATLAAVQVRRFVEVAAAAAPPAAVAHAIRVELDGGAAMSLRWDAGANALRAVPGEPTSWVEVPAQLLAGLVRSAAELSDRRLVTFARSAVARVKVIGDARFVVFERAAPGAWELRAPSTRAAPTGAVDGLLHALARVRWSEPGAARAAPGASRPAAARPAAAHAPAAGSAGGARAQSSGSAAGGSAAASLPAGPAVQVVELYDDASRLLARLELRAAPTGGGYLAAASAGAGAGAGERPVSLSEVAGLGLPALLDLGR